MTPDDRVPATPDEPAQQREMARRPLELQPLPGPPVVDMTARIEESRRRHEAELKEAERLVRQARAGSPPAATTVSPAAAPPSPGAYRVDIDWRGETAYYVESDRRVELTCIYWGGPRGTIGHTYGVWEHADGRRTPLSAEERAEVLRRVIDRIREREHLEMDVERA